MIDNCYMQVELACGTARLMCWLNEDERVERGAQLTIKQIAGKVWTVLHVYDVRLTAPADTTWDVGGLSNTRSRQRKTGGRRGD